MGLIVSDKNKFGYYTVGNFFTYSKVEAMELAKKTENEVIWHFNEEIFSKYDWTKEPQESLEELYARRAKEIRKKYDYIVIFYSGGADSQNILSAFLANNIFVDEIAQTHSYKGDGTWDSYYNEEVAKVAIPWTKRILEISPNTKHRVIDQTDMIGNIYDIDNNRHDFIYKQNAFMGQNGLSRAYFRDFVKDYQDIIASGKKLCFIWGKEKPLVDYVDSKYCIRFDDSVDSCVGPKIQMQNRDWEHDELFYWAPEAMDIVCKQGHTVLRHLKSINANNIAYYVKTGWLTTKRMDAAPNNVIPMKNLVYEGKQYYLPNTSLHKLIYPWWDPRHFTNGKVGGMIYVTRDKWWSKDIHDKNQQSFKKGIDYLLDSLGKDKFFYDPETNELKRLKRIMSQPYYLE